MEHTTPHHRPADEPNPSLQHRASTTVLQALSLPPYALTTLLQRESSLADGGDVPVILDTLARQNPTRAALALADLSGMILKNRFSQDYDSEPHPLGTILSRCETLSLIREAMLSLPTLDAIGCRHAFLQIRDSQFLDATAAAMYSIIRPHPLYDPPKQIHNASYYLPHGDHMPYRVQSLHKRYSQIAAERCERITNNPELSPRNEQLLSEFRHQIAPKLFPVQNYGYGSLSDILEISKFSRDLWAIKNPWGDSPDAPSPLCHQCADSAPAARSFFVSHGVPADVYIMRIGTVCHNVCVVFFQEERPSGIKLVPTLVDASPYDGFYELDGTQWIRPPSFLNPIGSFDVFNQRSSPLSFVEAVGFGGNRSALAPWCCEDLPSGRARIVGFGGVVACQKYGGWLPERGTPEYYGGGIRTPRPELSLYVMPRKGDQLECLLSGYPFISLSCHENSGRTVWNDYVSPSEAQNEFLAQLRADLLQEIQPIASRHLHSIRAMIERSGYSLEERVFR
jgi:hypothetical protein